MDSSELEKMVKDTVVKIDKYLSDNLPQKWVDIHDDIVWMNIYLMDWENMSEQSINEVIEMIAQCRKILEFGDKIVKPRRPILLKHTIFGAN
jgi:hypothetical protein